MILVNTPPHKAKEKITTSILEKIKLKYWYKRKIPYPPNFNKTAARTIDPATGASTCALGSHKCTVNMGSFTKKAVKHIIVRNPQVQPILLLKTWIRNLFIISISDDLNSCEAHKIVKSKGKEAATV